MSADRPPGMAVVESQFRTRSAGRKGCRFVQKLRLHEAQASIMRSLKM